jgi:glycosyltransferase involved in cell wall biosynthesis
MFTIIPVLGVCLRLIHVKSILLAPRGELSPGALSLKTRKKRLFLKVWRPLLQQLNIEWHASTDQEAQDISSTFPGGRVIVNCDQVSPPFEPMPAGSPHEGPIRMVFISRISPKKNLLLVLKALCLLSSPAEFDIFGPTEDREYWANCQSVIGQMPLNVRVLYRGELVHQEVRQTFSRYDAFVLPTLGENFGHVIAESLSASCPVICSEATPWTDLLDAGGGTIVRDLSPEGLAVTLEDLVHLSPSERVAAKQSAGNAFLAWRSSCVDANVLDQFRHGPQRG